MNTFNQLAPTPTVGGFSHDDYSQLTGTINTLSEAIGTEHLDSVGDIKTILLNTSLSEAYQDILMEDYNSKVVQGVDPLLEQLEQMNISKLTQLMENSAAQILNEAGSSNLNPIVGLTFPLLKYNWIENVFKDYFQCEVATTPVINRQIQRMYMLDGKGNRLFLPDAFNEGGAAVESAMSGCERRLFEGVIPVQLNYDLMTASSGSVAVRDEISRNFRISEVTFTDGGQTATVKVNIKPDAANCNFTQVIKATINGKEVVDMLSGSLDYFNGILNLGTSANKITGVKVKGTLASENNLGSASFGWQTDNHQFVIPVGRHLNTGLSKERMMDEQVIYNSDSQAKAIAGMSMILNQMKDYDMLKVLDESRETIEGSKFCVTSRFDCRLNGSYAMTPVEYRTIMLKEALDKMAEKLKRILRNQSVFFSLVGHPDDVRLLKDINWQYTNAETVVGGCKITYSYGLMNAEHKFVVLSSAKCKPGEFRVIVRPMTKDQISYIHFDYSFIISNDYRDPNQPNVPSIMTTQRYLTDSVVPIQGVLKIEGNDTDNTIGDMYQPAWTSPIKVQTSTGGAVTPDAGATAKTN